MFSSVAFGIWIVKLLIFVEDHSSEVFQVNFFILQKTAVSVCIIMFVISSIQVSASRVQSDHIFCRLKGKKVRKSGLTQLRPPIV